MKDNSELIDKYLSGELDEIERISFENRLVKDAQLAEELEAQKLILHVTLKEGVKSSFEELRKRKLRVRKIITWTSIAAALIIGLGIFNWLKPTVNHKPDVAKQISSSLSIHPPLAKLNKPLKHYIFQAEKGDTLISARGSAICFPAMSLVDASGAIVSGNVDVFFREFDDLLDVYLSGVPMQYDSGGVKYNFESAAMCEIRVSRNGKPLFVNQNRKPQILLTASVADSRFNLYQFDTVKKNWINKGKDKLVSLDTKQIPGTLPIATINRKAQDVITYESAPLQKPVKPSRAEDGKPKFEVAIEPDAFEELQAYNGLKFQVVDVNNYDPEDANEHWDDMKLKSTTSDGNYRVEFTNAKRSVSYLVKPVLNDEYYVEAMKVFQQKQKDYETSLAKRKQNEKIYSDSISNAFSEMKAAEIKDSTEVAEYNAIIYKRNKELQQIRELNKRNRDISNNINAISAEEVQKFYEEMQNRNWEVEQQKQQEIYRGFTIDGFGFWNIDCPHRETNTEAITLIAKNKNDSLLNLSSVALVKQGENWIQNVELMNMVLVNPGASYFVWGLNGEEIWFADYETYKKSPLNGKTKILAFKKLDAKISDYEHLRRMIDGKV